MISRLRLLFYLTVCSCIVSVLGDNETIDWTAYERGGLGKYPQVNFRTIDTTAPLIHVTRWNSSCNHGYVFISPHGDRVSDNRIYMLDHKGHLIWHHEERGSIHNVQVQTYKGNDFITYWIGDDDFHGHGAGYYKMIDQSYNTAHVLTPANGHSGDYHEFSITRNDTALITSYVKTPWDLSSKNRANGFIWDCIFQELDVESDQLILEWRASDHFDFSDMTVDSWSSWTGTADDPWDWFHLNSVEKDRHGNYLIAARYTNAVTYINGQDGHAIWHLGGRLNTFYDFSEGNATRFVDPHMARWHDDDDTITLFDNIDFWTFGQERQQASRGLKIDLETDESVARATTLFRHPDNVFARSEGSMQKLDNGNVLVGYGSTAIYSEFDAGGSLLCDAHFAPAAHTESGSHDADEEAVQTYRVYKGSWVAQPKQPPRVVIDEDMLYVSWNGATEVETWVVEARTGAGTGVGRTRGAGAYTSLGHFRHEAFETQVQKTNEFTEFRLSALDRAEQPLGVWVVGKNDDVQQLLVYTPHANHAQLSPPLITYILMSVVMVTLLLLAAKQQQSLASLLWRWRWRRRAGFVYEKEEKV